MPTIKPPSTLGSAGKAVWGSITSKYALRADELVTLEDACFITDVIVELEAAWAKDGKPMTTSGSMGQQVIHPLIGEIRTQRMARNALWRQLKLPDEAPAAGGATDGSTKARKAAASRWDRGA
jgi:hypothetical protein